MRTCDRRERARITGSHVLALVLLLYLTADFVDPSVPGVFFFDSTTLFLETVIQPRGVSIAGPPAAPATVAAALQQTAELGTCVLAASVSRMRPPATAHAPRSRLKHDCPTAFAPAPSTEDH